MPIVHVEDEDPDAAVLDVVSDAGHRDVKEMAFARRRLRARSRDQAAKRE